MSADPSDKTNTLRVENEALARGFTLIPNTVLRARNLTRDAKLLYGILLSYAWQTDSCFPGYETLMEDMQCAREALAKYIKELRAANLIEVKRRGQGKTSLYTLKDVVETQKFEKRTSRSSEGEPQGVRFPNADENPVELDSEGEERTNRIPSTPDEIRSAIESYVRDWSIEFRDRAKRSSSVGRAFNLFEASGLEFDQFRDLMYEAREVTKQATNVSNRMSYWFGVLEQRTLEQTRHSVQAKRDRGT